MPFDVRSAVQQFAPGLLSLLGIKNRGQNPADLVQTLQPVIDVTHWLHAEVTENKVSTYTVAPASFPLSTFFSSSVVGGKIEVPRTEIWWIYEHNSAFACGVGTTALEMSMLAAAMYTGNAGNDVWRVGPQGRFLTSIDGYMSTNGLTFRAPSMTNFWAPPGAVLGTQVAADYTSGADAQIITSARFVRLQL